MRLSLKYANLLPGPVRAEMEALVSSLNAWIGKRNTWTDVPYNPGDFSGLGLMTWTVGPECITTLTYQLGGDSMRLWFEVSNTSIGGTVGTDLQFLIPDGKVADRSTRNYTRIQDNGAYGIGNIVTTPGSRYLTLRRLDATWTKANWTASTKATSIWGQIDIPLVKG